MPDLEKSDSNESLFFYDVNGIPFSIFSIFNCKFYILNLFFYLSALNQFMWKWHYSVYLIRTRKRALIKG